MLEICLRIEAILEDSHAASGEVDPSPSARISVQEDRIENPAEETPLWWKSLGFYTGQCA